MRQLPLRSLTNILIIIALSASASLAGYNPAKDIHTIPFEKSSGLMLIDAIVDGVEGKLIFDTGSDVIILNGASRQSNTVLESISGEVASDNIHINSLQLGSYTLSNLDGYHADLSHLAQQYGGSILGIFGANAITAEILHINNVTHVIELYPNHFVNTIAEGQYHKASLISLDGLPAMELTIGSEALTFLLDTGCTVSIIDCDVRKKYPQYFAKTDEGIQLSTASGITKQKKKYIASSIRVSSIEVKGLSFLSEDLPKLNDTQLAGILSIDQLPFEEMMIDWSNKFIYFKI